MTAQHRLTRSLPRLSGWGTRASDAADHLETRLLAAPLDLRAAAAADEGTFEGYACVWDVTDTYGTRFAPHSFSAGGLDADPYALLWMHDRDAVLGTFTATEDERGLFIRGAWDDTTAGRDARARALSGSAPGLSVGFSVLAVDPDDTDRFTQVRLVETSQIVARMASVPGASLTAARHAASLDDEQARREAHAATTRLALAITRAGA